MSGSRLAQTAVSNSIFCCNRFFGRIEQPGFRPAVRWGEPSQDKFQIPGSFCLGGGADGEVNDFFFSFSPQRVMIEASIRVLSFLMGDEHMARRADRALPGVDSRANLRVSR